MIAVPPPQVLAPFAISRSDPTPASLTEPSRILDCEIIDERFVRTRIAIKQNGARGFWRHYRSGRVAALRQDGGYELSSADLRFSGWQYNRDNLHGVQGVNFTRRDGVDAVVQFDRGVLARGMATNIGIYVQLKPTDLNFNRYVGFCRSKLVLQQPLPDDYEKKAP